MRSFIITILLGISVGPKYAGTEARYEQRKTQTPVDGSAHKGQPVPDKFEEFSLILHNKFRANHGSPALTLNYELCRKAFQCAQYYTARSTIDHTCPYKGSAGENLAYRWSSSPNPKEHDIQWAHEAWYDEIRDYNFRQPWKRCGVIGHFTQMIWSNSTELGFGIYRYDGATYMVALYNPSGNLEWIAKKNEDIYKEYLTSVPPLMKGIRIETKCRASSLLTSQMPSVMVFIIPIFIMLLGSC